MSGQLWATDRPRFVLVRGLAREAGHWHEFDAGLLEQFPGATVERHELAGTGARWREPSPSRTADMAADLRSRVWAVGPQPPVLVAVSLGAMVCLDWLRRWPDDPIAGLVAINTSVGGVCRVWERLTIPGLVSTLQTFARRDPVAREVGILALTSTTRADDLELARAHAQIHRVRPVARANVLRQVLAAARFRAPSLSTRAAILLLGSARDRMVDPKCSREIARAYRAQLEVHPDAGHDLSLDDPRWCAAQIRRWLSSSERGGASG